MEYLPLFLLIIFAIAFFYKFTRPTREDINRAENLKKLIDIGKDVVATDPLEGLDIIAEFKRYLGEESKIVYGPILNHIPSDAENFSCSLAIWLCKTQRNNWFKLMVELNLNGKITSKKIKTLTELEAREYLYKKDQLEYKNIFGEPEIA